MKTIYVNADGDGRISSLTEEDYGLDGYQPLEVDDSFDVMTLDDYRIKDGALEYTGEGTAARGEAEAAELRAERQRSQLVSIARMQVSAMSLADMTDTEVAEVDTFLPDWVPDGHGYRQRDAFQWGNRTWRVSQDLTSQSIYPPDSSEALYYEIVIAPDGIIVYRECHGDYDKVFKGERRHYPDADGPVYEALDDMAYSPGAYPEGWKLVG